MKNERTTESNNETAEQICGEHGTTTIVLRLHNEVHWAHCYGREGVFQLPGDQSLTIFSLGTLLTMFGDATRGGEGCTPRDCRVAQVLF